ncbi:taxadiene 5-alpha hydroxylase [Gossypium australe]|uniref:Taxadiene 5-alpha hydroxylase n=1 Tax=Gossypium australe TaxID=47621 RepID=A0A5B6V9S6_9ROSI|nr:taxadiene 5-alpha hydroxylase [Gossypium australe]
MPRSSVLEFDGSWERYLSLVEFAYNNSYQAKLDENRIVAPKLVCETEYNVKMICESLRFTSD